MSGPTYNSRVWWLDNAGRIHWITSDAACQRWFQEKFYNTAQNRVFDGYTANTNPTGYLSYLYGRPIGANVDENTSPGDAYNKNWSYAGKVSGGYVLWTYIGRLWWLEPSAGWYLAHWIPNDGIAMKYWGLRYRYPVSSGGVMWPWPNTIDSFSIGPSLDH